MIQLGTALKSQEPPFHRCLVISDPEANGGQVVLVRVTTDDGNVARPRLRAHAIGLARIGAQFDGGLFHWQIWTGSQSFGSSSKARFVRGNPIPSSYDTSPDNSCGSRVV